MLLDLLTQSYESRSADENQTYLTNMYLEPDPAKGKYKVIALPTPGLTLFCATGQSQVRDMYMLNNVLYAIAGQFLYSVDSSGVKTQLGTLNTSTGFVKIRAITGASDNNHQLFMIDGTNGYSYNVGSNTFTVIADTTYIQTLTISASGVNYTNPTVTITDVTGTGATASASINEGAGQISAVEILNVGSNYTNPTFTFTDGSGPGTGASAVATVSNGTITAITVVQPGYNYVQPLVAISDITGTGATADCIISGGNISGLTLLTAGANYTAPVITITDPTGIGAVATATLETNSFPNNALDIENQDDYIIASTTNTIQFQISNVADTTTWDPLNFDSKTGQPDGISAILSHESRLWLFGPKTTETWVDSGASNLFPFSRDTTNFLHYGCPAKGSIAVNGNYFIFLSSNGKGGYSVFQTLPRIYYYNPAPISNPFIDYQLGQLSSVSDIVAWVYNHNGHEFYEMTSPTGNVTYVYDVPKKQQADQDKGAWYLKSSNISGTYGRFLGNCQAFCYGKNLIGDYQSGNIYYLDDNNYTENNTPIKRQFVSPSGPTYQGGKRVIINRLQIDVETGVGSNETFTLEKSLDNGNTWAMVNTYTIPPKGGRIFATGLGSTRYGMIFRVTTTMNAKFCLLGFQAEASVCHS